MTIGYSRVNRDGRITLQKRGNVRCYCNVKLRIGEPEEYILHRQNRPGNERQLSCGSSNSLKSCPKLEGIIDGRQQLRISSQSPMNSTKRFPSPPLTDWFIA